MSIFTGWGDRARGLFADNKGPWGSSGGGDGDEPPSPGSPGPWREPPKRSRRPGLPGGGNVASFDEFLKRSRAKFGGDGGGMPAAPNLPLILWCFLAFVLLSLLFTTWHRIAPEERGVVTRFGRYIDTFESGVHVTMPWPVDHVTKVDVENIREIPIGSGQEETLMLTSDQNIIDIAYQVRWRISEPEQYLFAVREPDQTIREVAESAMRAVIANVSLQGAMGNQRGEIEARVAQEMQATLDQYRSGVQVQGISLRQADPPAAVNDAFKEVTAAQQEAQRYVNDSNAYALQLRQKAQGDATAFDKVYEQYKLAPEVTRRRMYYETMERVLQKVDKTIIEAPGVNSYLPLNELRRQAPKEPAQ